MKRILISRTDNLGDVILTLPMAGILKKEIQDCYILFLGKAYTKPLIDACEFVDEFLDWDEIKTRMEDGGWRMEDRKRKTEDRGQGLEEKFKVDVIIHVFPDKEIQKLAKKVGIPMRIGTSHRWYSWLYCNKLIHYSRKNSNLHEAQLNLKLLEPLGIKKEYTLAEIPNYYGLSIGVGSQESEVGSRESEVGSRESEVWSRESGVRKGFKLILHPKSKGSAREWGLDNFSKLIDILPEEKYKIFITGTKDEGALMKDFLFQHRNRITDMTGKLSLGELLSFINSCDGLVAASTGPLHIAAALGKRAIGIYAPMRPIFPERWAPLGKNATYLVLDKKCEDCRKSCDCSCIRAITPEQVIEKLASK